MTGTFKVLSALLSYPTVELQEALSELTAALDGEALLPAAVRRQLDRLMDEIATGDLYDLQERYVLLFDRTRSLSLHLFEHVHGESRDRGQAMIDLKALYENGGLRIDAAELPDFAPLFLEFLSTQPRSEAYELLENRRIFLRLWPSACAKGSPLTRLSFGRSRRSRLQSPRPMTFRHCSPSPTPMQPISRRSMPLGRRSRSASGLTPATAARTG